MSMMASSECLRLCNKVIWNLVETLHHNTYGDATSVCSIGSPYMSSSLYLVNMIPEALMSASCRKGSNARASALGELEDRHVSLPQYITSWANNAYFFVALGSTVVENVSQSDL